MAGSIFEVSILHLLLLALILFIIGIIGLFVNKKSIISILMSVELMFLAININFVVFSSYLHNYVGQIAVLFIMAVSAAEIAIGLTILVIIFNKVRNIWVDTINE
ncbi:NADH-quinone oxidoreductase subunit NuoK [Rickettsiales bacterium LUAb2]